MGEGLVEGIGCRGAGGEGFQELPRIVAPDADHVMDEEVDGVTLPRQLYAQRVDEKRHVVAGHRMGRSRGWRGLGRLERIEWCRFGRVRDAGGRRERSTGGTSGTGGTTGTGSTPGTGSSEGSDKSSGSGSWSGTGGSDHHSSGQGGDSSPTGSPGFW
ncbi:MAG: hypothetical protein M3Z06_00485 [Actinomycetota bacterium]|nr:hypothetical protein [Actinomycetota bacterium]